MNDAQALARSVTCLLDNATPQTTWGDFQTDWDPIITALTCKLLLSCGLSPEATWCINRGAYAYCTLLDSFKWLNNSIRPDGTFGTDFWDAAQLAIVIEQSSLHNRFTAYPSLKQHLWKVIQTRTFTSDSSEWQGPGFYAAAIEFARLLGHEKEAGSLTKDLLGLQLHGSWQAHSALSHSPMGVWHTAQCVAVLATDSAPHRDAIAKGIAWLKRAQHDSGAWKSIQQYNIYFTSYAILALLHEPRQDSSPESPHIRKALEYLKSQIASDGKCSDLGGTLMCAMAFRAVVGENFEKDLTLVDYLLAKKNLQRADAADAALKTKDSALTQSKAELERYEKKYADADFVVTKKQLLFLALLALFITVLGTIAGVYGLNYALHTPINASPPMKQDTVRPSVETGPAPEVSPKRQVEEEPKLKQSMPPKHDKANQPPLQKSTGESQK